MNTIRFEYIWTKSGPLGVVVASRPQTIYADTRPSYVCLYMLSSNLPRPDTANGNHTYGVDDAASKVGTKTILFCAQSQLLSFTQQNVPNTSRNGYGV